MKQVLFITIPILLLITLFANSQTKMSRKEYIDTYKEIAIYEMHYSGIPASVTMAQACLESSNGNSALSRKSNNHFGIKCRNDWKGARVYHNDDKLNECFRKYQTVEKSFDDHTAFLMANPRYAYLFKLSHKDYKAWSHGLKKAGYATDPQYAHRLIKIIEAEKLYLLDEVTPEELVQRNVLKEEGQKFDPNKKPNDLEKTRDNVIEAFENLSLDPYDNPNIKTVNGLSVIYAKAGDTYESIARKFELKTWEVYLYNDLSKDAIQPNVDEMVYLERKRYNAPKGFEKHVVKPQETMHIISQKYGVRLNRLYHLNRMENGEKPIVGNFLYLRKRKPKSEVR